MVTEEQRQLMKRYHNFGEKAVTGGMLTGLTVGVPTGAYYFGNDLLERSGQNYESILEMVSSDPSMAVLTGSVAGLTGMLGLISGMFGGMAVNQYWPSARRERERIRKEIKEKGLESRI